MELFLRSLQNDMKAFAELVAANKKLEAENETLRSQVQKLELLCEKHKNGDISRTRGPTTGLTPDLSTTQKPLGTAAVTDWTQVFKRNAAPRKRKAPLSECKRLATAPERNDIIILRLSREKELVINNKICR